ncbi:alpha/beta fold hydrolase [Microbacterium azadirachtae]|uniref:alpha/beta fold hydrolase n=1 Tax=Microbacterium azadirachtae TaxID=582680 RepID=UPI000890D28C|nr:lysophospholipase [Microbacterium azadirachtae]SDL64807.1 Lysophospholipase, alpha-beta hydrolase superfamily [Microbacterium azadirachtae]SEF94004.1 Lysophospholipase, alpha-beta hydrolase superfamily [Microbacterium azadirachtae]SEF96548.1 Lysophospholipase, alpha-beta hydrolase superfamily [Microbacterium azadirachtae]
MSTPDLTPAFGGSVAAFSEGSSTLIAERAGSGSHVFLLVHGLGMGRSVFGELARRLDGTVVAVDLPGFGAAPEPELPLTMPEHADLIAAHLAATGTPPVIVIGHSMGSQVAAELAVRHPDRVRAVVLAAPTVDAGARRVARQALRFLHDTASIDPRVVIRGVREYLRAGPHIVRKIRATVAHRPEEVYPRIAVPTLVLRGERDPVSPRAWTQAVAEAIPRGEFAEIPGCGHETMIRDAEPAAARIHDFLSRI